MTHRRRIATALLALSTLGSLHAGLALMYSDVGFLAALRYGAITGSAMSVLVLGLWRYSHRVPWPTPFRIGFLARIGFVGLGFGTVFHGFDRTYTALREGVPPLEFVFSGPNPAWDILLWAFLGTTILVLFYGIRGNDAAHFHRLAAAQATTVATQAQLDTLRGQLNPHLIHNALHSVMALTQSDPDAARKAISDLGDLLRYTLATGRAWDVPLRDEWRFTQSYLAIEKVRLEDRLNIRTDIAPDTLDVLIPRFTLQPLVENAIRHGISKRPAGGDVTVRAALTDDDILELQVENPGSALPEPDSAAPGSGLGLSNLATRLRLRFGDEASLTLDTDADRVLARVLLPMGEGSWMS